MARRRQGPWQRKTGDRAWYTTVGNRQVKLGEASEPYERIEAEYHKVHSRKPDKPSDWTVVALCDEFLDFCHRRQAVATFKWYLRYLEPFCQHVGAKLKADDLRPYMVTRWVDEQYPDASPSTKHGATRAVVRVYNWAMKEGLLERNPVQYVSKPTPTPREAYVTPADFERILKQVRGEFRDVLLFLWRTGARPQEFPLIEAKHVEDRRITLDRVDSKGKKHRRVIYLDDTAAEIVERLCRRHPQGPIFRNTEGRPWCKDSMNCRMRRLREKLKIDGLCAVALRHGYITRKLKEGMDPITLGVLVGHKDPSMIAKTYQHLARDHDYLLTAVTANGEAGRKGNAKPKRSRSQASRPRKRG